MGTSRLVEAQMNLQRKTSVKSASTQNLDAETDITGSPAYANTGGTSSRGQITATLAVSDVFSLDGISIISGDRLLIKDEDGAGMGEDSEGIYEATVSGTALTLDRSDDFDADAEVTSMTRTWVEEGTVNKSSGWHLTNANPIVIGGASGTSLVWELFFDPNQTMPTLGPDEFPEESGGSVVAHKDHTELKVGTDFSGSDPGATITLAFEPKYIYSISMNGQVQKESSNDFSFSGTTFTNNNATPPASEWVFKYKYIV